MARGSRSASGHRIGVANRGAATAPRASAAQYPSSPNPLQDVDIMKSLGDLGQTARKRLQLLANQFNAKMNHNRNSQNNSGGGTDGITGGGAGGSSDHLAERRGLLDDGDGEDSALEFASRKDL